MNISIAQISDNTGIARRTVERVIRKLKDDGIIQREGSSRSGHWVILSVAYLGI